MNKLGLIKEANIYIYIYIFSHYFKYIALVICIYDANLYLVILIREIKGNEREGDVFLRACACFELNTNVWSR